MRSLFRHQRAYQLVTDWGGSVLKSAADLAQGYPIELRTSGTMQTLAFSMSKVEAGHAAMAQAIADWVLSRKSGAPLGEFADKERTARKLLQRLAEASLSEYAAADAEAIAFADAIKIISKAVARSG